MSRTGVAGVRVGGPTLSMFEAQAQSSTRSAQDVFAAQNATDPSRLVGEQLDRYGLSKGVRRGQASPATSVATIGDSSFSKISSSLSALRIPPFPGQAAIYVQDASLFPSSGSVYVGRNTDYFEGPLVYTSKVNNGSDWTLNLSGTVQRRHVGSEEVVLAQGGDRTVPAGTILKAPQGNALQAARFRTAASVTLPDGEVLVQNVQIVCQQLGEVGNAPRDTLTEFATAPFSGATVTNPQPITNGTNVQQDADYFKTIQEREASRSRGTRLAVESFAVGVRAPDEPSVVLSASVLPGSAGEPTYLTIDDGNGYQPIGAGVVEETIVGSGVGGERSVSLSQVPVEKGRLVSTTPAPWSLPVGSALAFAVGGVVTELTLDVSSYQAGAADPYALASDVNARSTLLWEAVVTASGSAVLFRAKSEHRDDIQSVPPSSGTDAAHVLGIELQTEATLFLYRGDRLLYKDGRPAAYPSRPFSEWGSFVGAQTLVVGVDGTPPVIVTVVDQDFVDAGTPFTAVGRNSVDAWARVLDRLVTGCTVAASGSRLLLTSNLGASDRAAVRVVGGSLVAAGLFAAGGASGLKSDFELDRSTGEIDLAEPLVAGERLAAGSDQTRAFVEARVASPVTLASSANWWIAVDSDAALRALAVTPTSVYTPSTSAVASIWGAKLRLTVGAGAFSGLLLGDFVTFWDPATPSTLYGTWTVAQVATDGAWFEIERLQAGWARFLAASTTLADGRLFVCGGYSTSVGRSALRSAEIFDPATRTWSFAGLMTSPRAEHWCVTLPSGDVLVGGGTVAGGFAGAVSAPEVWSANVFAPTSTTNAPTAAVGQAVEVVGTDAYVVGGKNAAGTYLTGTWHYNQGSDTWTVGGSLSTSRARHTLTRLTTFLWAAGGENGGGVLGSVEVYDTGAGTWSSGGALNDARQGHRASVVGGADILIAGGSSAVFASALARMVSTEYLTASTPPWAVGPAMNVARGYHGQALLSGGRVLVAGGEALAGTAETYNAGAWTVTGTPIVSPRQCPVLFPFGTNSALLAFGEYGSPSASAEVWTLAGGTWSYQEPVTSTFSASSGGLVFSSSRDRLRRVTIGSGTDLTAVAVQTSINAQLDGGGVGAFVDRRQTVLDRWRSNTWGVAEELDQRPSDLTIVTSDAQARLVGFPEENRRAQGGQVAWLLSGSPEVGTPDFSRPIVVGSGGPTLPAATWSDLNAAAQRPSASHWFVGLGGQADSLASTRAGQTVGHASQFSLRQRDGQTGGVEYFTLRAGPEHGWWPLDRFYFAHPYANGPYDDLVVVADRDQARRRYPLNLYRRLKPTSTTYSATESYQDADLSPVASLGTSFGIAYDFTDHAVYMRARGKTHASDASRRVLWRWWRHGSEGEFADVSYAAPVVPSTPATVFVDDTGAAKTHAYVRLAGGALKTGAQIRPSTRIGWAAPATGAYGADIVMCVGFQIVSAVRVSNITTIVLSLPTGVTNHGIAIGSLVYLASSDVNFPSGLKLVSGTTATEIAYAEVAADAGPSLNIGTISFDIGETTLATISPAIVANDWLRLNGPATFINFINRTSRVTSSDNWSVYARDTGYVAGGTTTLQWIQIGDPEFLQIFANPAESASTITSTIHALYLAGTSPIDPTVTGTGAGTIFRSSDDEAGARLTFFPLYDGRNAIRSQVAPGIPTNNFSFTLKDATEASIASDSDWINEDVRIAPVTAHDTCLWLQTPAVSGLFPGVRSEPALRGRHVQLWSAKAGSGGAVQVQGGAGSSWSAVVVGETVSANSGSALVCTIGSTAEVRGLVSGGWCRVDLQQPALRPVFTSATNLSALTSTGRLTVSGGSPKLWQEPAGATATVANAALQVEIEGNFVRYQDVGIGTPFALANVKEGDYVIFTAPATPTPSTPQMPGSNLGTMRVVRTNTNGGVAGTHCLWVERTSQQACPPAEVDVRFLADGSVLPGDLVTFGDSTWGAANVGQWVVSELGNLAGTPFADQRTINLSVSSRAPSPQVGPIALGTHSPLFRVQPPSPQHWFKRIRSMWPTTSGAVRVRLEGGAGAGTIGQTLGATLTHLDKLAFPDRISQGRDAYRHFEGLVREVNQVEYGVVEDPATYPGVISEGADIRIDGPKIKRIRFAVAVRLRQGYSQEQVFAAVRSAVATSVSRRAHGRPIPVSEIIAEVQGVLGVESVVPLSPYSSVQDMIPVNPGERAKVLDVERDVSVSLIG